MPEIDWTEEEIDAVVSDYFEMLSKEIQGLPYVKAEHNRALRVTLDRSRGSVEMKHCNISAVLEAMGFRYIDGYKPRKNLQGALRAAVKRHVETTRFFSHNRPGQSSG